MASTQTHSRSDTQPPHPKTILSLSGISKAFDQGGEKLSILSNIEAELREGELVALLGPSGSGKSTLLQIIGLLDRPDSGQIVIDGEDAAPLPDRKRTLIRRHKIGFVYQFHHLLPEFSALENLVIPQMILGVSRRKAEDNARAFLESIGLKDRESHRPARLSGGEQQRVAIARALINDPHLLLADEPTGNLDPGTSKVIFDLLISIVRDKKVAGLIATHNIDLARKMDRVVELKDGQLVPVTL